MAKREDHDQVDGAALVADYKTILRDVINARPSGTRQRIAGALGKNRSFVSQIANPSYPTPIPAVHVERIMEICHFSPGERKAFLDAYAKAHPHRHATLTRKKRLRPHTVYLPDLGDEAKNRKLDALVGDFLQKLGDILDEGD